MSKNTISAHIKGTDLQAYAALLIDSGFTVHVPKPRLNVHGEPIPVSWFVYERGGNYGSVSADLSGYSHSMPIRPSREHGSALAMHDYTWELRLEDAEATAQPSNVAKYGKGTAGRTFPNHGRDGYGSYYIELSK